MSQKKHKNAHRRAKKSKRAISRSRRNLLIGVAVVVVSVTGLIMAMVNDDASPKRANPYAASHQQYGLGGRPLTPSTAPQEEPKFTVTTGAGNGAASKGEPQLKITTSPGSGSPTPPALKITTHTPAPIPTTGTPAPDFTLQDLSGRPVQLSKLKGRVVVVNFWATWCGPCRAEIPGFVKAYEKYKQKGLEIVGVSINDAGREVVEEFVKRNGINYPVAIDTSQVVQKYGGVTGIPTTFIIDRQGRVAQRHVGYLDQTSFENMLAPLL